MSEPNTGGEAAPRPKKTPIDLATRTAPIVAWGYKHASMVILIVCCLVAFGVFALEEINKNEFPNFTIRQGLLVAAYPGATTEQIEQEVLKPMEDYVFSFKEVKKTKTHTQVSGGMVITYVELNDNINDTEPFWNQFKLGAQQLKQKLPRGVLAVEVISSFGDTSSLLITMSSRDKTYREMGRMMDDLKALLRPIESVGAMSVTGKQQEQIAVYVDPERLAKYGIGEKEIAMTLAAQGFSTTGGELRQPRYTTPVALATPLNTVKAVQDQVVFAAGTQVVRLGDVARVVREYPEPTSYVTNNGERSIVLNIAVKQGHNVVAMGREIEKRLVKYENELPKDVKLFRITNQPLAVHASVINFLTELLIAVIAVVVAIVLLLPLRVALIAASTIPITIFISLGIFYALGIELNTVTLACLIVSLGMIVDNSVIILDEYSELLSEGVDRRTATLSSATSYFKAIISATLAISITFFPFLLTMKGMFHDFLRDFPWAISIILFGSLIIAELLVPVMQYHFIRSAKTIASAEGGKGVKKHFTILGALEKGYDRLIDWCFAWPKTVLAAGVALVVAGFAVILTHPLKMMPVAERNQFAVEIFCPTGTPLKRTSQIADSLEAMMKRDKRVVSIASFHGCASPRFMATFAPKPGGPSYAQFIVNTVSNAATVEVLDEMTPKYRSWFPDANIVFKQLDYSQADYPVELRVSGQDRAALLHVADTLAAMMRDTPGMVLVRTSLDEPQVTASVVTDDEAMQRLGLDATALQLTLALRYTAGLPMATVWEGDYGIPVVVKTSGATSGDVSSLENSPIPLPLGGSAPLSQFATVKPVVSQGTLCRRNGVPTISVIADIERDGNAMAQAELMKQKLKDLPLPQGVDVSFGGVYEDTEEIMPELLSALAIAVVIIFFILLFHYKAVPVTLLLTLCLILVIPGTATGLLIANVPLSLTCTLGVISLMGILVRNVIIMLDYAELVQRKEGLDVRAASLASAKRRMRPIVLTSTAASMGVIPMMISDSGLWQPMGAVIFWGTLVTLVFILTFIPIAYWKFVGKYATRAYPPRQAEAGSGSAPQGLQPQS